MLKPVIIKRNGRWRLKHSLPDVIWIADTIPIHWLWRDAWSFCDYLNMLGR